MNGHILFSVFFFIKYRASHMNKLCSGPSTQGTSHIFKVSITLVKHSAGIMGTVYKERLCALVGLWH